MLGRNFHLTHVSSIVSRLDYCILLEFKDVEVGPASSLPGFGGDNLFSKVVDIEDRCGEWKPFKIGESVEG